MSQLINEVNFLFRALIVKIQLYLQKTISGL